MSLPEARVLGGWAETLSFKILPEVSTVKSEISREISNVLLNHMPLGGNHSRWSIYCRKMMPLSFSFLGCSQVGPPINSEP